MTVDTDKGDARMPLTIRPFKRYGSDVVTASQEPR
jgi:hypothetical protein